MYLDEKELCVLNKALDGKDVFSLPPFSTLLISDLLASALKELLIAKGLLADQNTFTDMGVIMTNRLRLFKQAQLHIRVGNVAIGVQSEQESILLVYNPVLSAYKLVVAETADCFNQVVTAYAFLRDAQDEEGSDPDETPVGLDKVIRQFGVKHENSFVFIREQDNKRIAEELYFSSGNRLYVYDCIGKMFHSKRREEIINHLCERMKVS